MMIGASGLIEQAEVRERVKQLQELFAADPDIARIESRLAQDWSGDDSVFIDVVLRETAPVAVITRLSEEVGTALLRVVRSEELGFHAYFNFVSHSENGLPENG